MRMSHNNEIFASIKYFLKLCNWIGLGPFINKKESKQYEANVRKIDIFILVLVFITIHCLNIKITCEDLTKLKVFSIKDQEVHSITVHFIFALSITTILFFGLKNNKLHFKILCKLQNINKRNGNQNIQINFKHLKKSTIAVFFLLTFLTCGFWLIDIIIRPYEFLNLFFYLISSILHVLTECQFIFCLYFLNCIMHKVNNSIRCKRYNLIFIQHYCYEVFELCNFINVSFNHILVRISATFLSTVLSTFWGVVWIKEETYEIMQIVSTIFWVSSHSCGIILILFFCNSVKNEVINSLLTF